MQSPKISIIVPVYKVPEEYLRRCIESIQAQTLAEIEIILVDDASPDDCGNICDSYAKKDARIRVIHQKNCGLAGSRNTGFYAATAKWIMFVDGDDWIEPDMCDALYNVGEENEVQLVMCGFTKDYGELSLPYHYYLEEDKVYCGNACSELQRQLLVYDANIAVAYAKLIDRGFLVEENITHDAELRQGAEGLEFNLRLFEKLESAIFVNKPFYHYRYNESSISASHSEENHAYVLGCFKKIREFIETSKNRDLLLPWFHNRLLYVIVTTAISGYFNPTNTEPYYDKKRKYKAYLEQPMVQEALSDSNRTGLSRQRKITLFFIEHKMFWVLNLMGKMRKRQKEKGSSVSM